MLELAKAGAAVAINYHSDRSAAAEVAQQVEHGGGRALLLPGDVADLAVVERMVGDTVAAFGSLTIAVGNAVYSDRQPFYEADLDRISPHDRREHVGLVLFVTRRRPSR